MDSGGMPADWTPPPEPAIGSKRWLDDMAFKCMCEAFDGLPDRSGVFELPDVVVGSCRYPLGYFVLHQRDSGKDYFRVEDVDYVPIKPRFTEPEPDGR